MRVIGPGPVPVFAAPGGAALVYAPPCVRTEAGRALPADKHTMALVVRLVFPLRV